VTGFSFGESSEIESARLNFVPRRYHGDALLDEHFVDGQACEVNGGGLPPMTPECRRIKTATFGDGEDFRDARRRAYGKFR